ncbi:hypothetical protein QVD17_27927 [Tagetes erecta]|uniref:Uncharacterized protein n=1 Tax=Tagetes erecta TaxID=13708 RepID=A0AAD8KFX2_TARER|nr:hypothetical protein QVD17_27927 [Tagetes erecta]
MILSHRPLYCFLLFSFASQFLAWSCGFLVIFPDNSVSSSSVCGGIVAWSSLSSSTAFLSHQWCLLNQFGVIWELLSWWLCSPTIVLLLSLVIQMCVVPVGDIKFGF